jgi:hypothetical protein
VEIQEAELLDVRFDPHIRQHVPLLLQLELTPDERRLKEKEKKERKKRRLLDEFDITHRLSVFFRCITQGHLPH